MTDIEKKLNDYMMKAVETQGKDGVSWILPSIMATMNNTQEKSEKSNEIQGKKDNPLDRFAFASCDKNNQGFDLWPFIIILLIFGLFPFSGNSYNQGKIDAYENFLKGFDNNER